MYGILTKLLTTLILGMVLAAVNMLGGMAMGAACFGWIGYIPDLFPNWLTWVVVSLFFLNIMLTLAHALISCWCALGDDQPLRWCMRQGWWFLAPFMMSFIIYSCMLLAGASSA